MRRRLWPKKDDRDAEERKGQEGIGGRGADEEVRIGGAGRGARRANRLGG